MAKKILSFLEELVNEKEFIYPFYRVQEAGYEVDVAANEIKGVTGESGMALADINVTYDEVNVDDYEGLLIPGGMSPDKMRKHEAALEIVRKFNEAGKPIGMICHGPWVGVSAGIFDGKRVTSTGTLRVDLTNAGAEWVDEETVVDGNLVTARKPEDLPAYTVAFIDLLNN